MNVLLIEDDPETATFASEGLTSRGHQVEIAPDGHSGLTRGSDLYFDCLVVDRLLPGFDGLTLVRTLRGAGVKTPVIFLTAVGGVADRVEGLRAGADDYLIKPFDLEELAARIEALGRRPPISAAQTRLSFRGLELNRLQRSAQLDDAKVELTGSEFKLLELLILNAGHAVTRAMILQEVFGLDHPNPAAIIEPHVSRLRAKLSAAAGRDPIRTVRRLGYKIDAT